MRILTKKTRREVAAGRLGFYCGSPENAKKLATRRSDLAGNWLYKHSAMFSEEKKRARQERWKAAKKDNTSDGWIERNIIEPARRARAQQKKLIDFYGKLTNQHQMHFIRIAPVSAARPVDKTTGEHVCSVPNIAAFRKLINAQAVPWGKIPLTEISQDIPECGPRFVYTNLVPVGLVAGKAPQESLAKALKESAESRSAKSPILRAIKRVTELIFAQAQSQAATPASHRVYSRNPRLAALRMKFSLSIVTTHQAELYVRLFPGQIAKAASKKYIRMFEEQKSPEHSNDNFVGVELEMLIPGASAEAEVIERIVGGGGGALGKYVNVGYDSSVCPDRGEDEDEEEGFYEDRCDNCGDPADECECDDDYRHITETWVENPDYVPAERAFNAELRVLAPIGEIYDVLRELTNTLDKTGGYYVNKTCGMHVHHDQRRAAPDRKSDAFRNLVCALPVLGKMVSPDRTDSSYCHINSTDDLTAALRNGERFLAVNPMSLQKHNTLEVRLHHGYEGPESAMNWIRLTRAIMDAKPLPGVVGLIRHLEMSAELSPEMLEYIKKAVQRWNPRDFTHGTLITAPERDISRKIKATSRLDAFDALDKITLQEQRIIELQRRLSEAGLDPALVA